MTWLIEEQTVSAARERAERALRIPLGMTSPLWLAFGAATSLGVTWWWMTRWTKAVNLEAMAPFRLASPVVALVEPAPAIEIVIEAAAAPVAQAAPCAVAVEAALSPQPEALAPMVKAEPAKRAAPKAATAQKPAPKAPATIALAKTAPSPQAQVIATRKAIPAPVAAAKAAPAKRAAPKIVSAPAVPAAKPAVSPEPTAVALEIPVAEAVLEAAKTATASAKATSTPKPVPAPAAEPDDLTRLVGVGAKLADSLAARGVTRFSQIAAWTGDDLAKFDAELSLKGRAVRDSWVAQAKRFARARS